MNVHQALQRFRDQAGDDLSKLVDQAEAFLAAHQPECSELSTAIATWTGNPRLEREVEHRSLALADGLRSLHRFVAAGVDAERPLSPDPDPEPENES